MDFISKKTGLTPQKIRSYAMTGALILVVLGIGNDYLKMLLGVGYPCFMSFLALETETPDDDKQWLTYWVVFCIFNIVDTFGAFILRIIPFYGIAKLCFLIWLMHPDWMGATTLYNKFILPYMKKYEKHIIAVENSLENAANKVKDGAVQVKDAMNEQMAEMSAEEKEHQE